MGVNVCSSRKVTVAKPFLNLFHSMKKRDGFNRMITDALDGKIDLILTKSVSRFARNTVDSLTTVRKLKEKGVEVYFEKENILLSLQCIVQIKGEMKMKGAIIGDIVGSIYEFHNLKSKDFPLFSERGRFTDDTVMTVAVAMGMLRAYETGDDLLDRLTFTKNRRMFYI